MKLLAAVVLMLGFVAPASVAEDADTPEYRLFEAAYDRDLGAVEDLLDAGVDPNARWDGYPILQIAVRGGGVEIIESLLAAGADVNSYSEWVPGCCQHRDTALHQAVLYWAVCYDMEPEPCAVSRTRIIRVLIDAGADVNARGELSGFTPLDVAELEGFTEVMDILVRAGADPNVR